MRINSVLMVFIEIRVSVLLGTVPITRERLGNFRKHKFLGGWRRPSAQPLFRLGCKQVHSKLLSKELGDELALDAVTLGVERRSKRSQSAFPGGDSDNSAANSTFSRHPDVIKPITGSFIQPGSGHYR